MKKIGLGKYLNINKSKEIRNKGIVIKEYRIKLLRIQKSTTINCNDVFFIP